MRKRREVTEIMSDQEFNEREELIEEIQQLGNTLVETLEKRPEFLHAVAVMKEVHSQEDYEQRRFLRRPITLTRTKKENLALVLLLSRPHIWLTMDKRFARDGHRSDAYVIDLSGLHVITLRALRDRLRTYIDNPSQR